MASASCRAWVVSGSRLPYSALSVRTAQAPGELHGRVHVGAEAGLGAGHGGQPALPDAEVTAVEVQAGQADAGRLERGHELVHLRA